MDKRSFCAGIAIGKAMKGWASYPSEMLNRISIQAPRLYTPSLILANAGGYIPVALDGLHTPMLILVTSFSEVS